ncbi:MAG: VCBS repeat-containing protein [Gemmatimonadota bacterium]|nr:MAG: VCBS repeat-containing protein [Gemmatimonadota bacterium]
MKILKYLLCFVCLSSFYVHSDSRDLQNTELASEKSSLIDDSDLAAGLVDVGELKHTVFNNGLLGPWGWSFYTIPELPSGWYKGYGYIAGFNVWIGAPVGPWTPEYWSEQTHEFVSMGPTVSEAELHGGTDESDWGPRPTSLGVLHSGDALVEDVVPNAPLGFLSLVATSTFPTSWPLDAYGKRRWPGPWGVDPRSGHVSEGRFISDEDLFFSITDGPYASRDDRTEQGYPLDIQLDVSLHAFDHPYEDFIIYSMDIINRSRHDYAGLYVGVFFDADIPEYDRDGIINDRADWLALNREFDLGYIYDYRWGSEDWPASNAQAYRVHAGIQFLMTPGNVGLTDWHWFHWEERPGVVIPERQERIQYAVLSGDTTDLEPQEHAAYFHPDAFGQLDPHFDAWETVRTHFPTGLDCAFLMSAGPFDLDAEDTTLFRWALVMGEDSEDLLANAGLANALSQNALTRLHPKIGDVAVSVEPFSPDTSRVMVTVECYDHDGISEVQAVFVSSKRTAVDSLRLYDDGFHEDDLPGDSLFGNRWLLTSNLQQYFLSVVATDSLSFTTRVERADTFWAGVGVLPPFDLRAEGQEEKIYLNWSPSEDPRTLGYHIYYDSDGPGPPYLGNDAAQGQSPVVVPSARDSSCVLSGLQNGRTYHLNITAFDVRGHESGFPEEISAVPGTYNPPVVSFRGLSLDGGVSLRWEEYAAHIPADFKDFHVYRSNDLGINYNRIHSTTMLHYMDDGLTNAFPYLYAVTAEDSAGHEQWPAFPLEVTPVPQTPGFPIELGGDTDFYGATVADVDGDDAQEIVVSHRDSGGYALHLFELDGSERSGWPVQLDFPPEVQLTTRAVGDVDGGGELEIVAGCVNYDLNTASGVSVYAWHSDGTPLSGWPQEISEAYFSAVALGDVDGDGDLEIVAGSLDPDLTSGSVSVWHHDGVRAPGWPKANTRFGFAHPTLGDLNGDGCTDIVCVSDSLYAWDGTGQPLDGWPQPCNVSYNSPNIGDVDGDGDSEVLVATLSGRVYAWQHDGTLLPGWPVTLSGALNYYSALGDVDGDRDLEFMVPTFLGGGLYVLNTSGSGVDVHPLQVSNAGSYAFPRVADVDGREGVEILSEVRNALNGAFSIHAWQADGSTLFGWPIATFGSNYDATVCDINDDGLLDIVTAQGPYVMSYSPGHSFDPERVEWATTHHDLFLTNSYGFDTGQTAVVLEFFSASGGRDGVVLQWSISADSDIASYSIRRANRSEKSFFEIDAAIEEEDGHYLCIDRDIIVGTAYYYLLEVVAGAGTRVRFGPVAVAWSVPTEFYLSQNYPNPFNPTTSIQYSVVSDQVPPHVTLKIYNILGQDVRTLINEIQEPGYYAAVWDGRDEGGREVSSGVYYFRLIAGHFGKTKSMVLLR